MNVLLQAEVDRLTEIITSALNGVGDLIGVPPLPGVREEAAEIAADVVMTFSACAVMADGTWPIGVEG